MSDPVSRRRFLVSASAVLGLGPVLAACGGGDVTAASCNGYDALTPADLQTREALGYVDAAPNPASRCDNCRLFNQPEMEPEGRNPCGGCQLFQGPVSPGGWCRSWSAATA